MQFIRLTLKVKVSLNRHVFCNTHRQAPRVPLNYTVYNYELWEIVRHRNKSFCQTNTVGFIPEEQSQFRFDAFRRENF